MKRNQSLKGKKVFREVLRKGRRFYEREIQVIAYHVNNNSDVIKKDTPELKSVKVGIQIQKQYGNSVIRNRAKRRVRAICSELLQVAGNNFFIIIRPKENFKLLDYNDSRNIIETAFKKAGILRSL